VKATELLSAELSNSTGVMVPSGISGHGGDSLLTTVGWLFAAFVVVITAIAAMVAYEGNNTMVAKITVSHVAAPPS
jgi:hypothetical protein